MFGATPAPVARGNGLVHIGGIPFVRTPIANGVNDAGLLVARTPLTVKQRWEIANQLGGLVNGQVALQGESGDADVVARGPEHNPTQQHRWPLLLAGQELDWTRTVKTSFTGDLAGGARVLRDDTFANHPAVNITWIEGASAAAHLTDGQSDYLVRMIKDEEYDQMVTCGGKLSEQEIKALAHIDASTKGTVAVIGANADKRTNEWDIVDAFGNVWTWTGTIADLGDLTSNRPMELVRRLLRGASFLDQSRVARVAVRYDFDPGVFLGLSGVRFVAVPRTA